MHLTIELILTDDERLQLASILNCKDSELETSLQPYARAAFREYITMILGQKILTRGADMREFRLFLLIREVFANQIPDEQVICKLFQTTTTQSRSLIRSVMSKYQYELQEAIHGTLVQTIKNAREIVDEEVWVVIVNSENIVDALNRTLASIDGTLPQVTKRKGTVSTYELKPSSYQRFCQHFNIS